MISVHAIHGGGGRAAYYLGGGSGCEHELEAGVDPGYYTDTPDPVGRWVGDGAEALGLTGELTPDGEAVFRELLNGRFDGEQISKPVMRGKDELRRDVRISGYDVTISAPKSVSTLMALGSPEVVQTILQAHANASDQALDLLEQLSARAARGHHGDGQRATRIPTEGLSRPRSSTRPAARTTHSCTPTSSR